jgi:hypothetical protein
MTKDEVVSIKEYIDMRFSEVEKARIAASTALDHRLNGMNEIRDSLRDQRSMFIGREEYIVNHKMLEKSIHDLELSKAILEGKANQSTVNISMFISVISILLAAITLIIHLFGK